jgi:hypothetical protein
MWALLSPLSTLLPGNGRIRNPASRPDQYLRNSNDKGFFNDLYHTAGKDGWKKNMGLKASE